LETDIIIENMTPLIQVMQFQPITTGLIIPIAIVVLLLACSALISGSEVAYFSLKPSDIAEMKSKDSRLCRTALSHLEKPEQLLATILISNNFVNIAIVVLASYITGSLITYAQPGLISFVLEVIAFAILILFFGEILPKVYAGQFPKKVALFMSYPLLLNNRLFKPLSMIMVKSTELVKKRLDNRMKGLSMNEISHAFDLTDDNLTEGKDILKGIVTFGSTNVENIMTVRVNVVDIDIKSELSKVIAVIVDSGYSRMPVYEGGPDDVKGVLYVKDLLPHLHKDNSFNWQQLIRPAYFVPETKRINDLLQEFKTHKIHMAVVVDEYGGTSGIVTLEDILEEIVGDISDELDDDEVNFSVLPDGNFVFEGTTLLKDFFRVTEIPEATFSQISDEPETLAGLLLELKGEIPVKHETIEYGTYKFTILAADNRRIKKIRFAPN
jgi:putative hemolysin